MLSRGIIVSIQGYHYKTMTELALDAISAGCVGIRTDKKLLIPDDKRVPIVGLRKISVMDVKTCAYITPTPSDAELVALWADLVAVDCRRCNASMEETLRWCAEHGVKVVADIETYEDFEALSGDGHKYEFVATTLSVFKLLFRPNLRLVEKIAKTERRLIAEGNFTSRKDVKTALDAGAHAVCIGGAISNVYKLTRKYTSVPI